MKIDFVLLFDEWLSGLSKLVFLFLFSCAQWRDARIEKQDRVRAEGKPDGAAELTVFAAASLTEAITKISRSFESKRDVKIYMNFAVRRRCTPN